MTPVNNLKYLRYLLVIVTMFPVACFAQEADSETLIKPVETKVEGQDQEQWRPRLKFRKGPVCMCNGGMSEADIQAAMKKRLEKLKTN